MPYNRYRGNSGRVERVDDRPPPTPRERPMPPPPHSAGERPPGRPPGPGGELGRLIGRLSSVRPETEDILLLLILYLLYRESSDWEFLIMIAGMLFL